MYFAARTFLNLPVWVDKMYACGHTEVSKVFATLSLDPWHKGRRRRLDEENNPATVRWIDTMPAYIDMWGCTRLITPEASWDAERLKRPYSPSLSLFRQSFQFSSIFNLYPCFAYFASLLPLLVSRSLLLLPHVMSANLPSRRIAFPRWDFQTGA